MFELDASAEQIERDSHADWSSLTPKQRRWIAAYMGAANGRPGKAAELAGYAGTKEHHADIGYQLKKHPLISRLLYQAIESDPLVCGYLERLHIRSAIARDVKASVNARLVALEQLDKIQGTYAPTRLELSGPEGGPIQLQALERLSTDELAKVALEPDVIDVPGEGER
jgi:hypothetical protein